MPFWSKDTDYKGKLEHKLCVARETPEPVFDLADCNLHDVPSGVFSMCRVFLKEVLLLQNNHLQYLQNGGMLKDLSGLKVLNLSGNKFYSLPEDIRCLTNLEVLNLENNQLKKLPASFSNVKRLLSLNLRGNNFQDFPLVVCELFGLKKLNISCNKRLKKLPKELSNLTCLENLELDVPDLRYPPSDVCSEGMESILKFLCQESGKEYIPATDSGSNKQDSPDDAHEETFPVESEWNDSSLFATYQHYQRAKEQRQKGLLQMELHLKETDELQAQLASDALLKRQKLLEDVTQEQEKLEQEIMELQDRKDKEKQKLLAAICNIEDHSAKLIEQLMCLNEKNKRMETILETLEKDRIETEEMFSIKQEELEELRKHEILDSMKNMLEVEEKQRVYEAEKLEMTRRRQGSISDSDARIAEVLIGHALDQQALISKLLEEERYQKEAFEKLHLQRDKRHQEISYQIKLIEEELSKLTLAEVKKQDLKANLELNVLAERRTTLAVILTDLLEAKEFREQELKKRLQEMEDRRMDEMKDFWLIQYQKLLDKRPPEILDAEANMDPMVREILLEAGATHFLPLFAIKSVSFKQLLWMSFTDLKKIGIMSDAICEAVLTRCQEYIEAEKLGREHPQGGRDSQSPVQNNPAPSAPPEDEELPLPQPSAPPISPESHMKLFCQAECVICLDKESTTVFIPCGHVCCCWSCSDALLSCPLCRNVVSTKFVLSAP